MNQDYTHQHTVEFLPPHNIEAEKAVLGSLVIDPDAIFDVATFLKPEAFYNSGYGRLFAVMLELFAKNHPIDPISVAEVVRSRDWLDEVVGTTASNESDVSNMLYGLMSSTPTSIHIKRYAEIVHENHLRRQLARAAHKITTMAYTEHGDIGELIGRSEALVLALGQQNGTGAVQQIGDVALNYMETVQKSPQGGVGLPTGYADLDKVMTLRGGEFTLIAARPGMGKTALLQGIGMNAGLKHGKRVLIFSLEMGGHQLVERHMSPTLRVESSILREGGLDDSGWQRFGDEVGRLSESKIYISNEKYLTPSKIRAQCLRFQAEHGLDLVLVDYLQLMQSDRHYQSKVAEVGEISRSLKILASELNIPLVAACQLSRAVEQRQNKRPMLSDLRESGSLEQDADNVWFIYRDEYYNAETTDRFNIAEVSIAKQRMGPTGTIDLYWNGRYASFGNLKRAEITL